MNRDYYVMDDQEPRGMNKIRIEDAGHYNERKLGVFWTVNDFGGQRRLRENLKRINSWFIECDDESKAMQIARIENGPLVPSLVVESKRGYHVYFNARAATVDNWREIMSRVRHYYNGDPRAKDLSRALRAPGYYHWKDPSDPFMVSPVSNYDVAYLESQMLKAFPPVPQKTDFLISVRPKVPTPTGGGDAFWTRMYNFNCIEALKRLSGTHWVSYETYSFRPQPASGKHTIVVNGKPSSCWIDAEMRIGSLDHGGPSIWQWLKWFGHSNKVVAECLKAEIPELWT